MLCLKPNSKFIVCVLVVIIIIIIIIMEKVNQHHSVLVKGRKDPKKKKKKKLCLTGTAPYNVMNQGISKTRDSSIISNPYKSTIRIPYIAFYDT